MIPKIIHYCWFGRKPLPPIIKEYIENWKVVLPDYEIKEWNEDNFDYKSIPFTREAYAVKKYAFVSDVARLYALINEGGIYLDTDVRVIKNFNSYLGYNSFLGKEFPFKLSTAVIGSEAGMKWMIDFYDTYKVKHFILKNGSLNLVENTALLSKFFNVRYPELYQKEVMIFDVDYFSAKNFISGVYFISNNTVSVHEFLGSWSNNKDISFFTRVRNVLVRLFC